MSVLREFGTGIWVCDGPTVPYYGFQYPTRMALIQLPDEELLVWSPVALSMPLRSEIVALGNVRFLVSPNRLHHLFLKEWKSAYPQARTYALPELRKKRPDIAFDGLLGDSPEPEWASDIDQVPVRGSPLTEVEFFHRPSRTAIFADLIQNFPPDWFNGWRAIVARLDGICAPNPGAPREWRMLFYDRRIARAAVERILAWPIERVLIAHGEPVMVDGRRFVRRAFKWLLGPDLIDPHSHHTKSIAHVAKRGSCCASASGCPS
ncbi:MAG TPA: hypothetical protein VH678_19675 [Xanthobacteraceae bacterium]|jgi:hypothetical protein